MGGAALRSLSTDAELLSLSARIDPSIPSPLDYYPLPPGTRGERFPSCDPSRLPALGPAPADRAEYLHGLLESIARVEAEGYRLLGRLGATRLQRVATAGGGARNPQWTEMRRRVLGVPVEAAGGPGGGEAAYGSALLARGDWGL